MPETLPEANDQPELTVSLSQFLNEQRSIIASDLSGDERGHAFITTEIARKKAILAMLDEQLSELAQPVETTEPD